MNRKRLKRRNNNNHHHRFSTREINSLGFCFCIDKVIVLQIVWNTICESKILTRYELQYCIFVWVELRLYHWRWVGAWPIFTPFHTRSLRYALSRSPVTSSRNPPPCLCACYLYAAVFMCVCCWLWQFNWHIFYKRKTIMSLPFAFISEKTWQHPRFARFYSSILLNFQFKFELKVKVP